MEIKQFRYAADNLAYLVYDETQAIAIDPGAVNDILAFLNEAGIQLKYIVNTHTHPDHMTGNGQLIKETGATYLDMDMVIKQKSLSLPDGSISAHHTPGHSQDSVVYCFDNVLVAGDTLFNGKVGRCFTGDLKGFLTSIKFIMTLPDDTIIYSGHDYVLEYMETAKTIEPDNKAVEEFISRYDPAHVYSTLADEYRINPTLRFNTKELIDILKERGLPVATEYDRWQSVMSIV